MGKATRPNPCIYCSTQCNVMEAQRQQTFFTTTTVAGKAKLCPCDSKDDARNTTFRRHTHYVANPSPLASMDPLVYTKNSSKGPWFMTRQSLVKKSQSEARRRQQVEPKAFVQPVSSIIPKRKNGTTRTTKSGSRFLFPGKSYTPYVSRPSGLLDIYQLKGIAILNNGVTLPLIEKDECLERRCVISATQIKPVDRSYTPVKDQKQKKKPRKSFFSSCLRPVQEQDQPPTDTPRAESGIVQDNEQQIENTVFVDQRETVVEDGYVTSQHEPNMEKESMPESQWHIRNIMSKPIPFFSGSWSVSDTAGKVLQQWKVPGDTLYGPHYNVVSTFTFFRGHPTIRFQINGTKFHCGRLIAAFIPNYLKENYDSLLYSPDVLTSLPHVILDASISNSGVLNLPFVHQNSYFNSITTRDWQTLGTLILVVFNRLQAVTTASQSIGVTAWVHYDNCELHQPCFAHSVAFVKTKASMPVAESGIEGLVKSALPMVKDLVAPELSLTGNVLGSALNCDKPTDPVEITRWVPNAVTGLAQGDGIDRSSRLCLKAGTYTVPEADMISTTKDDMNLLEICKIPTRLSTISWTSSQVTGTMIAQYPVCPNLCPNNTYNAKEKIEQLGPTLLAYNSRYFKFWRGGLRYKIQIIASQMHTGRLMITFGAGLNLRGRTGSDFQKAACLNNYVIDLQECHEVEFVAPFMAERPWLRCDRFRKLEDDQGLKDDNTDNFENVGFVSIFVLNALTVPDNVSKAVDVNIFISAADDFELAFPTDLVGVYSIGKPIEAPKDKETPKAESLASGETTVTTRTENGTTTLVKGSGRIRSSPLYTMGENAMDLKTVLRRYCHVYHKHGSATSGIAYLMQFPNSPTLSGTNKCFPKLENRSGWQTRTAMCHFAEEYTYWRGSIRYKIIWSHSTIPFKENYSQGPRELTIRVYHTPGEFKAPVWTSDTTLTNNQNAILSAFESQGVLVASTKIQGSLEFEIPFYTPYNVLRTLNDEEVMTSKTATGMVYVVVETPENTSDKTTGTVVQIDLYQAAGDDFELVYLRAPPYISFKDTYDSGRNVQDDVQSVISGSWPTICPTITPPPEVPKAEGKFILQETMPDGTTRTRPLEIPQVDDFEAPVQWPFTENDLDLIIGPYVEKSPFFRNFFKQENILDYCNSYFSTCLYKKGTPSYYRDWLLGSRRRRDDLVAFVLEKKAEKPVAEGITDYIPGVSTAKRLTQRAETTSIKVESVCDTANHLMLAAAKKLGLASETDSDETDSEGSTTLIEDAANMCSPIIPILHTVFDYIKLLPNEISQYLKPNLTVEDVMVDVSNLVSGFFSFSHANNYLIRICAVVTIVSTLLKEITCAIKNQLYHFATQVFSSLNASKEGNEEDKPKSESAVFDLVAPLTATLAVGIGAIGFKKIPTDKETIDMCRGISEKLKLFNFSSTAMTNVKGLWQEIKDLIQWAIDYVMNLISPHLLAQLKLEREFEDIENWAQFIDSLDNIAYADKIHYDYEFRNKIYRAIDTGKRYNQLILEGKCGRSANVVREYVRKITEIGLRCEQSKNELPFRKDPFCIFVFGKTNIGKSGCVTNLAFDLMDRLNYPRHNRWCSVNCSDKYFSENYRQQAAVYFDDFGTFVDEEQYKKFFNLKANTAFPLDMAFRKGEYFNSDFVFATTNDPYPAPNFLTTKCAFLRRRDILIEADWAGTPEIREALANGENMNKYRKLDNSHLVFRIVDSVDPNGPAGPWRTFAEIVDECYDEAKVHLEIQQAKVTHDLERAGYLPPVSESKVRRRICHESLRNSSFFSLYEPAIFQNLEWDEATQTFECYATDDHDYIMEQWTNLLEYGQYMQVDVQEQLKKHSYIVKEQTPLRTKITTAMKEFKDFCKHNLNQICKDHPWVKAVGKWTILLAAAMATIGVLWYGTKTVIHKCICATVRHYGYRCGFCGKWPMMKNVKDQYQPWMLSQWRELYGDAPYVDNHITPLQEEAALLSLQKTTRIEITEPFMGTKVHAEGIYSDVTKGQTALRLVAQAGPYNMNETSGQRTIKITANSGDSKDLQPQIKKKVAESATDTIITSRIFPYLYRIRTQGKPGLASMAITGYAIGDRWLMTNKHLFYGLEEGDVWEIFHNGAWLQIEYNKEKVKEIKNKDLVLYDMPKQFHAHKSNVQHFISEKDLAYFQSGEGSLCKLDISGRAVQVDKLQIKALKELNYVMDVHTKTVPIHVQNAWKYNKCSSFGDCGSPLVAYSDRISGKIIGIHIASDSMKSYSQLVTREMIQDLVIRKNGTPLPDANAEAKLGNLIPDGHLGRIGKTPKGKEFFQSPKTEIIPTAIHGVISPPKTFPSVLSSHDPRLKEKVNPLRNGIEKYSHCAKPFPLRHRKIVNEMMKDEVRMFVRKRDPEPLTMDEACNGIPELEGYERLPRNTSPGYPWILTRPKGSAGKEYLFEDEKPVFDLQRAVEYRDEQARKLERIESVWVDCLKDERRSLEKIEKGSTRMFTIPPVDFSILMRKYTLDFCVAVKDSREFMDCKVGIDPQSLEWTTLYYWLAEFSPFVIAGDFSRFDGSMPAELIDDVREDIDYYYSLFGKCSEEDKNARKILFDELIHTVHLARDEYYMTHIGNKSGNPITVILNSRINKRYMALSWLGLAEKFGKMDMFSMAKFQQFVRCAIYGDDNALPVKEEVLEWYNQETISEYLLQFGIIYTNEEKTGVTKFKHINDITFLKQSFKDHESIKMIKVPHMSITTILELLNWTRIAPDQDQLLFDNCNDALRFSYFYGERFFNQLREKIIKALHDVGKNWLPKTYMDFHLWFLVTIGALKTTNTAEGFLSDFASKDTDPWKRTLAGLSIGPAAWLVAKVNGPVKDDGRIRNSRIAICIPSGEGKSWLARHYPQYFVDHDDVTLPALEKEFAHLESTEKWMAIGNALLNPQRFDTPENDKRILLTHHPNTTNRTVWRQYVLPYPNFNRNNFINRLLLDRPVKCSRDERNKQILAYAKRLLD